MIFLGGGVDRKRLKKQKVEKIEKEKCVSQIDKEEKC